MRKLLSTLLVTAIVMALAPCAVAENVTGYVKTGTMEVYASPTTSSRVLATMCRGQKVTAVAYRKGWCQLISPAGRIGYCEASKLSKTNVNSGRCWVINDTACLVHKSNGQTVQVTYGQCFTFVNTEGSRTYIMNGSGEIGYIDSNLVTRTNPFNLNKTVYTQVSGQFLHKTAFGKSSAISVPKNAKLTLLSVSPQKSWAAVLYNGKLYYAFYQLIGAEKAPSSGAVYTMRTDAAVYEKASWSSLKEIARVNAGDSVRLTGFAKGFGAKITTRSGISGYIMALPIIKK